MVTGLDVPTDRTVVMGVLNVTPDSFSDGGEHQDVSDAIAHGLLMRELGADIVDVGGESTRPGARRIDDMIELARILPVIKVLAKEGVAVSIDTMRASVAQAALDVGAVLVNDVSGGQADPAMLPLVAERKVPIVLMHWRGHSERMQDFAVYDDVVVDVTRELRACVDAALAAGIDAERIVIDPGVGFAKEAEHNWALLADLAGPDSMLGALGFPVLVGTSRKRFLGSLLADADGTPRDVHERDVATHATTALLAAAGVWGVRVHDVAGAHDAVLVGRAWSRGHA